MHRKRYITILSSMMLMLMMMKKFICELTYVFALCTFCNQTQWNKVKQHRTQKLYHGTKIVSHNTIMAQAHKYSPVWKWSVSHWVFQNTHNFMEETKKTKTNTSESCIFAFLIWLFIFFPVFHIMWVHILFFKMKKTFLTLFLCLLFFSSFLLSLYNWSVYSSLRFPSIIRN